MAPALVMFFLEAERAMSETNVSPAPSKYAERVARSRVYFWFIYHHPVPSLPAHSEDPCLSRRCSNHLHTGYRPRCGDGLRIHYISKGLLRQFHALAHSLQLSPPRWRISNTYCDLHRNCHYVRISPTPALADYPGTTRLRY